MKKNILQFIGSFHQGGSERQALQLARMLQKHGDYNVFVAVLNDEGVLRGEAQNCGFAEIVEFPLTSFYDFNFLKQLKKCVRFIKQNKIEIVHTHDFYTNVFGMSAATLARVPLKIASKRETGGMRSNLQAHIEKLAFKRADLITVNAAAVKDFLIAESVAAEKIRVVYNGLDLERLQPKIKNRKTICDALGLPIDKNVKFITLVANLRHAVKNQPMFLRAASFIREKFPNAHFVLAGEGDLQKDLESLADELKIADKTHFVGRCTIVPELLAVSLAGVLTSFNEGFSNSILEYMAAGLPVVATKVGGAAEAIGEGETGFLIASDDDKTLAERLIFLLENPDKAARMGANGRKTVVEKFSCAAQLEQTLALYESGLK